MWLWKVSWMWIGLIDVSPAVTIVSSIQFQEEFRMSKLIHRIQAFNVLTIDVCVPMFAKAMEFPLPSLWTRPTIYFHSPLKAQSHNVMDQSPMDEDGWWMMKLEWAWLVVLGCCSKQTHYETPLDIFYFFYFFAFSF